MGPRHQGADETLRNLNDIVRRLATELGVPLRREEAAVDIVGEKRARTEDVPHPFPMVVDTLSEKRAFLRHLTAGEARLLDTVVTQSALLPDIAALRDVYHPCVALYDVRWDVDWSLNDHCGVHLGVFTSTILTEYCGVGGQSRRFTFAHILRRMAFAPVDVHAEAGVLDETFYRRILTDPPLSFLAATQAPKLVVFRGVRWARLMDQFLRMSDTNPDWIYLSTTITMAEETLREQETVPMHRLVPHTVLGALLRAERRHGVAETDGWLDSAKILEVQTRFLASLHRLPAHLGNGLQAAIDTHCGLLRAWPVCLRSVAVRHVRERVRSLRLIPRTLGPTGVTPSHITGRPEAVDVLVDWLMDVHRGLPGLHTGHLTGEDGPTTEARRHRLRERVHAHLVFDIEAVPPCDDTEEVDETALRVAVIERYGPVMPEDEKKLSEHLENLATLVTTALQSNTDRWTRAERATYGRLPEEVLHGIEQDVANVADVDAHFREECNRNHARANGSVRGRLPPPCIVLWTIPCFVATAPRRFSGSPSSGPAPCIPPRPTNMSVGPSSVRNTTFRGFYASRCRRRSECRNGRRGHANSWGFLFHVGRPPGHRPSCQGTYRTAPFCFA